MAQGETLLETLAELEIVSKLWLETAQQYGQKLPDVEEEMQKLKALSDRC